MKTIVALTALVALTVAAPQGTPDSTATIVRYDSNNIGVDGYSYNVETSNGIRQQEDGQLTNAGTDNESISVRGSFSYTGSDGVVYSVRYIADENGFQPEGSHLPVAP